MVEKINAGQFLIKSLFNSINLIQLNQPIYHLIYLNLPPVTKHMKITFDFEKPLADLQLQIDKVKQVEEKTKVDMSATLNELQDKFETTKIQIYANLSGW